MGGSIDVLINLVFLAIAIGVFLKLRSVLGRRTGHERPPFDPYSAPEAPAPDRPGDKVIPLPQARPRAPEARATPWSGIAEEGSALAQTLTEIALADRNFDPKAFISGARIAYEMIVTAFAAGDRKALAPLLEEPVLRGFETAIAERESAGLTIDQSFIGIRSSDLLSASLAGNKARLTVKFVSELTSCTKNRDGVVVSGDPVTVRTVTDIWTFERDVSSRNPNWRLAATESPN